MPSLLNHKGRRQHTDKMRNVGNKGNARADVDDLCCDFGCVVGIHLRVRLPSVIDFKGAKLASNMTRSALI